MKGCTICGTYPLTLYDCRYFFSDVMTGLIQRREKSNSSSCVMRDSKYLYTTIANGIRPDELVASMPRQCYRSTYSHILGGPNYELLEVITIVPVGHRIASESTLLSFYPPRSCKCISKRYTRTSERYASLYTSFELRHVNTSLHVYAQVSPIRIAQKKIKSM